MTPATPGHALGSTARGRVRAALALVVLALAALAGSAAEGQTVAEPPGAVVRVSGFWFLKNRDMRELLTVLEPEGKPLRVLDAAFIEDAVLVFQSALVQDGHLKPSGSVRVRLEDGTERTYAWTAPGLPDVPRGIAAVEADFRLNPGVLYFYERLEVEGLSSIREQEMRSYFINETALLGGRKARMFSPGGLDRGCESLREKLRRLGRGDAQVTVAERTAGEATGAVSVRVRVDEGPVHRIGGIELLDTVPEAVRAQIGARLGAAAGGIFSSLVRQDLLHQVHVLLYEHGYAEAAVRVERDTVQPVGGEMVHTLTLGVDPGPVVRLGEVRFQGDEQTRESVLRRETDARSGQLFDRNRVEDDRLRLSGLGVFSAVRAEVTKQTPELWDLTYQLRPSKRLEVGLLAGYGSYERWRGGLEAFHGNWFGRAERGRFQLIGSAKSTLAEYQLTVPQIFGTTAQGNARAFGLDREEVSFDRREVGVSTGVRRHFDGLGMDVAARYQYERLRADNVVAMLDEPAPDDSNVGAVTFDITQDRRDNPLTPRTGYELNLALETAATMIGSDVDYQKLDLKASWHARVGPTAVVHAGLRHGLIWTLGNDAGEIPINKRYFPGGDTTVRGHSEGTAAPRGDNGEIIGAEVSTVANFEIEAVLVDRIAAVVFVDAGITGASIDEYPGDQVRVSVGLGVRYNSIIGPVRLEYGHNIVRETGDQRGKLHFSLGFPF